MKYNLNFFGQIMQPYNLKLFNSILKLQFLSEKKM